MTELTQSFQGIADKLLPRFRSRRGLCGYIRFWFPNAVPFRLLAGAVGQFLAIGVLILLKMFPVLVIAGFVPVFFDNATIAVYANNKGGMKAALVLPFISGLCQVFGSAFIAYWVGNGSLRRLSGNVRLGDSWPAMTRNCEVHPPYVGIAIVVIGLLAIPQIQYRKDKEGVFPDD